jgi:predicted O-methyltransferase YrrM
MKRADRFNWHLLGAAFAATALMGVAWGQLGVLIGLAIVLFLMAAWLIEGNRRLRSSTERIARRVRDIERTSEHAVNNMSALLFLREELAPSRPFLEFGPYSIKPDFAAYLVKEIATRENPTIVELGSGVSTLISALAVQSTGGGLVSFESERAYMVLTRQVLERHGVTKMPRLIHAPLKDVSIAGESWPWYDLQVQDIPERIDILVVDGPPGRLRRNARYPALPLLFKRLARGAVVFLDDARREDEQEIISHWMSEFPEMIREDLFTQSGVVALRVPDDADAQAEQRT